MSLRVAPLGSLRLIRTSRSTPYIPGTGGRDLGTEYRVAMRGLPGKMYPHPYPMGQPGYMRPPVHGRYSAEALGCGHWFGEEVRAVWHTPAWFLDLYLTKRQKDPQEEIACPQESQYRLLRSS